ncbi:MAG: hypothetical protein MAG794_01560 [Gammaproteobacteria bacterium]|nr:hypothetical protein [Gammaproteobacteria bacterium]
MKSRVHRFSLTAKSLFYAIVIHVIAGLLVVLNLDWPTQAVSSSAGTPAPVQANVVSESEIQKQMESIRQKEEAKKQKQLEVQKKLEELLSRKKAEERKLAEIKKRQEKEKQKARELAEKKQQEQQELAKLEEREEEQRKQAQAEAERKREEEEQRHRKELAEKRQREKELQEQLERERRQRHVNTALAQYIPIIKQKVSRNWNQPVGLRTNIEAHINVRLSQAGEVLSARIAKSSGNSVFDRSVENAVLKASPLPIPQERGVNEEFRSLILKFKPEEMIS